MAVTIYEVAKRAGVGIGTVSRAINGSTQISPQTKERVLQAVKELKYQPHALAQGLARKKANTIASIVPFFTGYFFVELLRGIQQGISEHNYHLILYSVDEVSRAEIFFKRTLQERRVDGVLLISLDIPEKYVKRFLQAQLPIVLVDRFHPALDSIYVENEDGAYLATQHLIKLGHTHIGMINGMLKSKPAQARLQGYRRALQDYLIPFREEYLVTIDALQEDNVKSNDGFNKEAGYYAMLRLLHLEHHRPTAVFISSDIQAIGAMKAITESGLKVPADVAIVGYDDIELSAYLGLTTVKQPLFEMGKLAVERLMAKITGEDSGSFKWSFKTRLVVRESCGACTIKNETHE